MPPSVPEKLPVETKEVTEDIVSITKADVRDIPACPQPDEPMADEAADFVISSGNVAVCGEGSSYVIEADSEGGGADPLAPVTAGGAWSESRKDATTQMLYEELIENILDTDPCELLQSFKAHAQISSAVACSDFAIDGPTAEGAAKLVITSGVAGEGNEPSVESAAGNSEGQCNTGFLTIQDWRQLRCVSMWHDILYMDLNDDDDNDEEEEEHSNSDEERVERSASSDSDERWAELAFEQECGPSASEF